MGRKYESFNEYLEVHASKALKQVLLDYMKENSLYTDREVYDNPQDYKLDINLKISIPYIYHFTAPNYNLDFDIVVDVLTELTELIGDELQTNLFQDMFTLTMSGVLHNGLSKLMVHKIELGSCPREFDKRYSLSSFLVPYINKDQYEEYAREFLEQYYPKAINRAFHIRVPDVISKMGLNIKFGVLPDNCFGKCIFDKERITIFNFTTKQKESVIANPGTILINQNILELRNIGVLNNTGIHECLHWFLHRKYFELQKLLNSGETSLSCFIEEMQNPDVAKMKNKYYMELQARSIAPRILMPEEPARRKFASIMSHLKSQYKFASQASYIKACVSEFANFFGTSIESSKIRLVNIGFSQVLSVLDTVNGREIVPFKMGDFRPKSGQTFIIDATDASKIIKNNLEIRELVMDGRIIYVDGFFVINDPKYVRTFKHQKPRLTAHALKDVSKCCLLFDLINESVTINYDPESFNFFTFCNGGSTNEYTRSLGVNTKNPVNSSVIKKASGRSVKADIDEANEWIDEMRKLSNFGQRLTYLLGNDCMCENSDRAVGRKCHMDGNTVKSYKEGKYTPDLLQFIRLCGGLKMHPRVSRYLMGTLGYNVHSMEDDPYTMYSMLMQINYNDGLDEWNALIKDAYPGVSHYLL